MISVMKHIFDFDILIVNESTTENKCSFTFVVAGRLLLSKFIMLIKRTLSIIQLITASSLIYNNSNNKISSTTKEAPT